MSSWGTQDINTTNTVVFDVQKNGSSVGSMTVQNNGAVVFMLTGGVTNFVKGERLTILAPGSLGTNVDVTLSDLSITIKGFCGPG